MKVGFIGTGNMGGALARAAAKAVSPSQIYLYDAFAEKADALAKELSCNVADLKTVSECDMIFLGVKPQVMTQMFSQLASLLATRKDTFVLISMAAGIPVARIQEMAEKKYPVIRIMPNMPVSVGCGMIQYTVSSNVTQAQIDDFLSLMEYAGILDCLPEELIDAGTSVASCGPAFAFYFIEALTKGGIECGLPEEKAKLYAIQMLLGSAKLALESDKTPSALREAVCSPGGSTIEGIYALQNGQFPETVKNAVQASYKRNQELGQVK